MRRLTLLLLQLCAILPGCIRSTTDIESQMQQIAVKLDENPAAALEMLEELEGEKLTGRRLKARFALLYSMALDKNCIDIASDSVINCAVKYYSRFGSPGDKLLAHYYHGVTFLNAADIDKAMDCFVKAGRYAGRCEDAGAVARLYTAKMLVYKYCYEFEKALSQEKLAAEYFLADGDSTRYFNALCSISTLGGLTGDSVAVFTSINLLNHHWEKLDDIQKSRCFITQIEASDDPAEKHRLIDENLSEVRDSSAIQWTGIANALLETGQFDAGLDAIESYLRYGGTPDAAYYILSAKLNDGHGNTSQALSDYKRYLSLIDEENVKVLGSNSKYAEERIISQLRTTRFRYWLAICGLSIVVVCLASVLLFQKIRRLRSEREKEKIEYEAELESVRSEIKQLRKIRRDKTMEQSIRSAVEERLKVLNMFVMASISDSFSTKARDELAKLMENRNDFLESTRKSFMIAHPKFIEYLRKQQLNEWETGCCCLYAIGLNGSEISSYLDRKAIYNVSSSIRRKLGIPKGKTRIDTFLRQKLEESDN